MADFSSVLAQLAAQQAGRAGAGGPPSVPGDFPAAASSPMGGLGGMLGGVAKFQPGPRPISGAVPPSVNAGALTPPVGGATSSPGGGQGGLASLLAQIAQRGGQGPSQAGVGGMGQYLQQMRSRMTPQAPPALQAPRVPLQIPGAQPMTMQRPVSPGATY